MFTAYATNKKTAEKVELGKFMSEEHAWQVLETCLVWDDEDVREDWVISVEETYTCE